MIDHTRNNLRAAMKALSDTVAPALDPADPMAREQLALVVAFLEYTRVHVHDLHARHRYELDGLRALAEATAADARLVSPAAAGPLEDAIARARSALDDPAAGTDVLRACGRSLSGAVRDVVRAARDADPAVRSRIERTVLERSAPLLTMQAAWSAPLGFDPDPSALPDLSELLAAGVARAGG